MPARWWLTLALLLATAVVGAVGQLAEYGPGGDTRPHLEFATGIVATITLTTLPAAIGWHWRHLLLACYAVGGAFMLGLLLADALTYGTISHNCNFPQPEACGDPGPFPATFLLVGLPLPLTFTVVGRLARSAWYELRKRGRKRPHLLVGADGHADRARRAEGA